MFNLNLDEYRDRVYGCWTGKNIGGTLGAPFEEKYEMNDAMFYTQELAGVPAPNDDLDLQLLWLHAAEENGLYNLPPRLLGEYWMDHVIGPWKEYSICRFNMVNGLYPPLSGSCNNDQWKFSNGAWIRSEIWACLFPGNPGEAIKFAYMDSCVDHYGEGIYAEMFTAALESAAFVIHDIRELIEIGLAKIPVDSRVARSVRLVRELYDKGVDMKSAREAVVKDIADLGWFQSPGNLGFVIIGLLYGEGDFGKSICYATNCGDDTDCTAATVGAILGIMMGRKALPRKWTQPIGESIVIYAINPMNISVPKTLLELTNRVTNLAIFAGAENPRLSRITQAPTLISTEYLGKLKNQADAKLIWGKNPYELIFDLPYCELSVIYEDGVEVEPGVPKKLSLVLHHGFYVETLITFRWLLPETWLVAEGSEATMMAKHFLYPVMRQTMIPGKFDGVFYYLPLEIRRLGRNNPIVIHVPFQRKGAMKFEQWQPSLEHPDEIYCHDHPDDAFYRMEARRLQ